MGQSHEICYLLNSEKVVLVFLGCVLGLTVHFNRLFKIIIFVIKKCIKISERLIGYNNHQQRTGKQNKSKSCAWSKSRTLNVHLFWPCVTGQLIARVYSVNANESIAMVIVQI